MSALTTENKTRISANRKAIFELEGAVNHNKAKAYLTRSVVAENATLISKNYNAAFLGNRQLANENTDALFRNRIALAQSLPSGTEVEVNFREATINAAKLAYLDHRSSVNSQVLSISQDISALNTQAIAINRRVMESNESIRDFNSALIAENSRLIENGQGIPTPESNQTLIAANAALIAKINGRVAGNNQAIEELLTATETNRKNALANSELIAERRVAILKNHDLIAANRERIAVLLGAR